MNKSIIASLVGAYAASLAFSTPAFAEETVITTDDIIVKANRFEHKDTETTYASEVHTSKQIEASGAATLYDFLAQQTSLNILPNFGNKAAPSINLRGFGGENGFQNVVITVDGQRLNNIDSSPALIAGIPIGNIERIEIAKGSGSVIYGDGATAGAIQIYTKNKTGVSVYSSLGNYGQKNHSVTAGISEKNIDLSATLAHDSHDGFSKKDETGHKDQFTSNSQNVKLKIKPTDSLRFNAEATSSRNDIRYVNTLTKAEFKDDPRQLSNAPFANRTYTHQSLDTDQWRIGAEFDITSQLKLNATHFREDKLSEFITFASKLNYDYESNDIALSYTSDVLNVIGGLQTFDGDRKSNSNTTTKDNTAVFIQTEYRPTWFSDALTVSAGGRNEKVKYNYSPNTGAHLKDSNHLDAWDVGVNYLINNETSIFANYNQAFQSPDIDRFFKCSGVFPAACEPLIFNGIIDPAKSKTLNVGLNLTTNTNRLKITTFYADLDKEIYLNPLTGENTNIDDSHKYGLEVQDYFKFNEQLSTSLIYNYTRAIIDHEEGFSAANGKNLPGVPKHTIVANLNYKFFEHASVNLNHSWRSKSYVYNDFANNDPQKQDSYQSTNIAVNYQFKDIQIFASINNVFEHENSIQIFQDAIFPVDFVRTWRVGMKADF